jgi:hypothetical protein
MSNSKVFVRFSMPGGRGWIKGTSKAKFRADWIEILTFRYMPQQVGGLYSTASKISGPVYAWITYKDEEVTPYIMKYEISQRMIDSISIEYVKDNGDIFSGFSLSNALIDSMVADRSVKGLFELGLTAKKIEFLRPSHLLR